MSVASCSLRPTNQNEGHLVIEYLDLSSHTRDQLTVKTSFHATAKNRQNKEYEQFKQEKQHVVFIKLLF
jgi:hypothetical protein